MPGFTQNIKLNIPDFDQTPWDAEVNANWAILDATVGLFTAIPNFAGVWVNSHNYLVGQTVVDAFDSSMWYCLQAHTTPAAPTLFSADRISNPARWTQTSGGAQFYAQQAADAAAQAIAAATEAQEAVDSIPEMVPLAGGTMTGELVLFGDPGNVRGAATKQYVDARVGGTGFLPLSGGDLTGQLTVGGVGVRYTIAGVGFNHHIAFGWDDTKLILRVDGNHSGFVATQGFVAASYLPISGGTVTGNLTVNGALRTQSSLTFNANSAAITADSLFTRFYFDNALSHLRFTRSNNTLEYVRGYDSVPLITFSGDGNNLFAGTLKVIGALETDGSMFVRSGTLFWGAGDNARLLCNGSTYTIVSMLFNYDWRLDWGTGSMHWQIAGFNFFSMRQSDNKLGNNVGPVFGVGAYENVSDERTKENIRPSLYGLNEIMRIDPIKFSRLRNTKIEDGFSAQQLRTILPNAVTNVGEGEEILAVTIDPIVVALVNGMKDLATRMIVLEKKDEATRH